MARSLVGHIRAGFSGCESSHYLSLETCGSQSSCAYLITLLCGIPRLNLIRCTFVPWMNAPSIKKAVVGLSGWGMVASIGGWLGMVASLIT